MTTKEDIKQIAEIEKALKRLKTDADKRKHLARTVTDIQQAAIKANTGIAWLDSPVYEWIKLEIDYLHIIRKIDNE